MTVMAARAAQSPEMSVEEFERIAAFAAKETDDAVRFEFINGRIGVKKVADGDHDTIVVWLSKRCTRTTPTPTGVTVRRSLSHRAPQESRSTC
jgi:Uma2 family endonuclease